MLPYAPRGRGGETGGLSLKSSKPMLRCDFHRLKYAAIFGLYLSIIAACHFDVLAGEDCSAAEAQQALQQARHLTVKADANTVNKLFDIADRANDSGLHNIAREIVSILVKTKHRNCEMYCFLGCTYCEEFADKLEDSNMARRYFNMALQVQPDCGRALNELAYLEFSQGKLDDALKLANRAVNCKDPHVRSRLTRSKILASMKRYPEALKDIELAEKVGSKRIEIYRVKGSILEALGRYDEAVKAFDQAFAMQKQDWIVYQIVHCYKKTGHYREAIARLDQLSLTNVNDSEVYRERADVRVLGKDYVGAIKDLDKAIELEPTAKIYRQRAQLHTLIGHKDRAARDLAEADKISNRVENF